MAENIQSGNGVVARNTKIIIESMGLKQAAIAAKAGFSAQMFNDMLNGRKIMRANDIQAISEALNVEPNELFGMSGEQERR